MSDIELSQRSRGLWSDTAVRIGHDRAVRVAGTLLLLLVAVSLAGPALSGYSFDSVDWQSIALPPFKISSHLFGTDSLGRDLLVRTLQGVRISLLIGVVATAISLAIGVTWGVFAGYAGGRLGETLMRFVDGLYSLPYLFVVIILTTLFPRGSLPVLFVSIGAVGWLTTARIVRAETLSLKRREFIEAARATGLGAPQIVLRHIVPHLLGPIVVYATLTLPQMMLFESFLSFLGLGVQEPMASLGSLINDGAQEMQSAPWMLLVPGCALGLLLACFNVIGDALRDALDPRDR
jgi:oligopeptide transport system permease protein